MRIVDTTRLVAEAKLAVELANRIGCGTDEVSLDAGLNWLHNEILKGQGAVAFCQTENGDIGVFIDGEENARGVGDCPAEALDYAFTHWMNSPGRDGAEVAE